MVKIVFWDVAECDLAKLPRSVRRALLLGCQEIFDDWAIGKPLSRTLTGYRMHRVGVYRIIYTVRGSSSIEIVAIGHRKDIYDRAARGK